jgi:Cu+-exporting ATPase
LGVVEGNQVAIGRESWLASLGIPIQEGQGVLARLADTGCTVSVVAVNGSLAGAIAVADPPSDEARGAVEALKALGVVPVLLSGDRKAAAESVARTLGISHVFAEVLPEDKARLVAEERERGSVVAMVGDGINDAPALAAAHVGMAMGSGTDIAMAAADVALLHRGLYSLPRALLLARATLRTIRSNLFWAFVYNVIGLPIAAGVFYPWTGWQLSPALASAAMGLSSVSVLANSQRLRRFV